MTTHNLCAACETAAHCSRNGCIPLVHEPVCPCPTACQVPDADPYDDELGATARAFGVAVCVLALLCPASLALYLYLPNWM